MLLQVNVTEMATKLTVTVSSVLHYAEYTIEVVACHDQHFDRLRNRTMKRCSKTAVTSVRSKEIGEYPLEKLLFHHLFADCHSFNRLDLVVSFLDVIRSFND